MNIKSFIKQCSEKGVFKRLSIYMISSWLLIQVVDVTSKPLGLPSYSVSILLILLILGVPINLYLIWRLHIISDNADKTSETTINGSFKKTYFIVLSFASVISVFLAFKVMVNNFGPESFQLKSFADNSKIAILKFGNNTGKADLDIIGKMTSDWLIHGIAENQIGQTVSPKVIEDYTNIIKTASVNTSSHAVMKEYFKPGKIITGNYFLKSGKLIFQSSIIDGNVDKILISFKQIECSPDNPLECIETLKQMVLGYLITENKKKVNLQELPPKYKAYQLVLEAKANFDKPAISLQYLDSAIAIDQNYFEPKVLRVANYYNADKFKEADSLRSMIRPTNRNNSRQLNLLRLYESLLEGNNRIAYAAMLAEYKHAPFDIESNESTMAIALQFVNQPEDVAAIFDENSINKMSLENCIYCEYRVYIKAIADVELKDYQNVVELLVDIPITKNNIYLFQPLIAAYIRSNKSKELTTLLTKLAQKASDVEIQGFYLFTAKEYMLLKNSEKAAFYFDVIVNSYSAHENIILTRALYFKKDYATAEVILERLHKKTPSRVDYASLLAMTYVANKKYEKALMAIETVKKLNSDYNFGEVAYAMARYHASINNEELALKYLLNAVSEGYRFTMYAFQNDPMFMAYFESEKFNEILKYWQ